MERKREMTKVLLAESFKELMNKYPFEKITIKMITDEAWVIRPTFYNYFQDKYELLEWYFYKNIMKSINELIEDDMELEALKIIVIRIDKDKDFYRKCFYIVGQNSFEEIFTRAISNMFLKILNKYSLKEIENVEILTKDLIAKYYSLIFVQGIKNWLIEEETNITAEDMIKTFTFVISHSILDIINKKK